MSPPGQRAHPVRPRPSLAERRERRAAVDDPQVVSDAAAAFLAARPRSVAEVRRRLVRLGYRVELVEAVVGRFAELGYLDDELFARAWVESRDRARPRGERALRQELALKGVDRQTIDAVLAERASLAPSTEPDEAAARRLLDRHRRALVREPDPVRRRQKAYALLARSGFDPEVCRTVSSSFEGGPAGEDQGRGLQ